MPRNTLEYMEGLDKFLNFAFSNRSVEGCIISICPCKKCKFGKWKSREVVYEHLIVNPFPKGYPVWLRHGETRRVDNTIETPLMPSEIEDTILVNDPMHDMEKIQEYENTVSLSQEISTQDSLAHALGSKEHCGRVRGLGLGPCPSQVFGHPSHYYSGMTSSSPSYTQLQNQVSDEGSAHPTNPTNDATHSPTNLEPEE
ncbi:Transposase-associated domain [Sesbania bispinosa]|nr:Transposase-associated domain [Sesbania bispinosa]